MDKPSRKGEPGRRKGIPNKRTIEKQKEVEASGLTPLDYMISVFRDERNDQEVRLDAAKAAAPYVHARLAITQLDVSAPQLLSPEERRARVLELLGSNRVAEALGAGAGSVLDAEAVELLPGPGATAT